MTMVKSVQKLPPGHAMIVEDGTITHLNVEPGPGIEVSAAEAIMELL